MDAARELGAIQSETAETADRSDCHPHALESTNGWSNTVDFSIEKSGP